MNAKLRRGLLFLALSVTCSSNAFAQEAPDQATLSVNYNQADIRQIIAAVAEITGKKFVIHPSVHAKVSLEMATSVTVDVYYDIFLSILQTHGYEAVPSEGAIHIVPIGVQPGLGSAPPGPYRAGPLRDTIRPVPYFINGQMKGVRVYPRANRSAFDALGFAVGDLITGFDGHPLADPEAANDFLRSLEASTITYVTVDRDGESIVIQMK